MAAGRAHVTAEQAVRLHQSGDVAGAAAAYRALLAADPRNAQLLNLLGVASLQLGDAADAVALLTDAVGRQPTAADYHDNLGSALRAAGNPAPAVEAHRKALRLKPHHAPYLFNLGNALAAMGAHHQAVDAYQKSLSRRPGHAGAMFNLANSQRALGDLAGAGEGYRALLAGQPGHAQAWNNLGAVLGLQGELAGAEDAYRQSLAARPGHAETLSNLGNVLVERGRLGEGLECHLAAAAAAPDSAEARIFLGVALQELDKLDGAIAAYREGLRLDPGNIQGLSNLGSALEQAGQLAEAEAVLSQALALDSGSAEVWGNLGLCRLAQGDRVRARQALDRALELDPELARARLTRALLRLEDGDLGGGWADYAWRFAAGEALPDRRFAVPQWQGQSLPRGRLLIWREQGLGDELMFAGLYKQAIARAGQGPGGVTIECDPRLLGLFTRSFPAANVRAQSLPPAGSDAAERPDMDAQIPAGGLVPLLRPTLSAFPGAPYLVADRRRTEQARIWLDGLPDGLRVGICWRSRLITARRRANYAAVEHWAPLLAQPTLQMVSLQYGADPAEIATLEAAAGRPLHIMPGLDLTDDLEGLAGLISGLDLVVTAPTAVGEMAGALGIPVWRVLGGGDWSTLGAATRPWFASMRMITHAGGVAAAIGEVVHILKDISRSHG
ncbi:tetratricopeptide repeat protein [Niveispirillum sp. KHB5.9]|uniref:tetratricopeptide repeat protein n=1 Tax=Niveispirillum sp. KHB5.9 TaxID=3400269 RepID=UPI003A8937E7